jgi:acyl-CoA thioesterase-1
MTKQLIFGSIIFLLLLTSGCSNNNTDANHNKEKTINKNSTKTTQAVKTIIFFGNSLTAGFGLDPSEAFPALIQQKIDSSHLHYKVVNAGVSGETSSGGNSRVDWILKQPVDVFILELGANDGLRGIPVTETRKNLQSIIDKVKARYPQAKLVLAGMQVPPNMGHAYASQFRNIFSELAMHNQMALVPFLLEGVGGIRELNLPDGIHPTPEGHKIVANNVWNILKDVLKH